MRGGERSAKPDLCVSKRHTRVFVGQCPEFSIPLPIRTKPRSLPIFSDLVLAEAP